MKSSAKNASTGLAPRWLAISAVVAGIVGFAATIAVTAPGNLARHGLGIAQPTETRRATWVVESAESSITGWVDHVSLNAETPTPIVDLVIDPISGAVFATDTSRRLATLPAVTNGNAKAFEGLLAGLAVLDDGRIALCLGRSGYGSDYFVRLPVDSTPRSAVSDIPLGFCTRLLGTNGTSIFYATKQARLGRISATGTREWEIVLPQISTALSVTKEGSVLVGDDRGGLTLVNSSGAVVASFPASDHPITAVSLIRNGSGIVAVDRAGNVGVFNRSGSRLGQYESGAGRERIHAVIEHHDDVLLVGSGGVIHRLVLPEKLPTMSFKAFEQLRATTMVGGAALILVGLFAFSRRATGALRSGARRVGSARVAYFLLLPTFLLLALFNYFPMATALGYSFWNFSLTSPMEFAGLDNFRAMASDPYVRQGSLNMLVLLVTGVVKMMVLPLLAAELVFWLASQRLQQFFRAAVTFPAIVPGVVMVLVWKMIYDPYSGLLNLSLRALGFADAQRAWLGDEHSALWAVVFFNFPWINLLIFLIFLGGLIQVDRNLFEAADIDGASVTQRFLHIDLPALRPKLMLALTLIFLWSVQDYASVLILTGGGPGVSTYVPALQMFQQISGGQNLGYSSAIGLVLFALVLGFAFFMRRFNREELS